MRAVKPKVSPVGEGSVINLDKFNGEEVTYKNIVCLYLIDNNIVGSHSQKNTGSVSEGVGSYQEFHRDFSAYHGS